MTTDTLILDCRTEIQHLLSSTMRLIEVGNKLSSEDKKDEAETGDDNGGIQ